MHNDEKVGIMYLSGYKGVLTMIPESFYNVDAPYVKIYSLEHILYLLACFLIVFLFVKNRQRIRQKRDAVCKVFLGILLFQQVFLLYGWYALVSGVFWSEGLPLQLCRISSLLTIWFLIKKDNRIMDVIFYFSIYALISLFYPLSVYHFGHISGISYMINHLMTVLIPIFGAIAYGWKPGWKAFSRAAVAFTVYLPCAMLANSLTGGNYFYLTQRPFLNGLPAWIYNSLAYIVTIAGFAAATWLVHIIVCLWKRRAKAVN